MGKNCHLNLDNCNLHILKSLLRLENRERIRTSFFDHWTKSYVFIYWWSNLNAIFLASNEQTSILIELSLEILNNKSNWLEHHFFEHRTNSNMFISWLSNSNTLFLPIKHRTLNIVRPITSWYEKDSHFHLGYLLIKESKDCVSNLFRDSKSEKLQRWALHEIMQGYRMKKKHFVARCKSAFGFCRPAQWDFCLIFAPKAYFN